MNDVARVAGVGRSTVSHVINGTDSTVRISDGTRKRVLGVAAELGYRLHVGARSIRGKGTRCVGVMGTEAEPGVPTSGMRLHGISRGADENDFYLAYINISEEKTAEPDYVPRMLSENLADGVVILQSGCLPAKLPEMVERYNVPTVWLQFRRETDAVWLDEFPYGYEGAKHLIELGHRRICFLDFSFSADFWSRDRLAGYEKAMAEAGLAPDTVCMHTFRPQYPEIIGSVLDRPRPPTAFLTHSVSSALPLSQIAGRRGLRIPEDVSIIAPADATLSFLGTPRLTFWDNREDDLGYMAMEMLTEKLEGDGRPVPSRSLKLVMGEGESTGPCREA